MIKTYSLILTLGLLASVVLISTFADATTVDCTNANNKFQCIDYRTYFPTTAMGYWKNFANGWPFSFYYYFPGPTINSSGMPSYASTFQQLYNNFWNLNKPGQVYTIVKDYNTAGTSISTPNYCTKTYSNLFLGSDLSVTEVGDYMDTGTSCTPSFLLGYRAPTTSNPTGLSWASPGGLRTETSDFPDNAPSPAQAFNVNVLTQTNGVNYSGGYTAWNRIKVLEVLPTYTPPYGRSASYQWGAGYGKTYNNVIHIILYHGVSAGGYDGPETTCYQNVDPNWSYSKYYYHWPGYNSYASEYYIAQGMGIIQETDLLYNEYNPSFGTTPCTGMILFTPAQLIAMSQSPTQEQSNWITAQGDAISYIDQQ